MSSGSSSAKGEEGKGESEQEAPGKEEDDGGKDYICHGYCALVDKGTIFCMRLPLSMRKHSS